MAKFLVLWTLEQVLLSVQMAKAVTRVAEMAASPLTGGQ